MHPTRRSRLLAAATSLLLASLWSSCTTRVDEDSPKVAVHDLFLVPAVLNELSGLAYSRHDPALLWAHNDSGDAAILHQLDATGRVRGSLRLRGVNAVDWEDMASFTLNGKPMLLVADTGDNRVARPVLQLVVMEEPLPSQINPAKPLEIEPSWILNFSYEDGPHDCESVAVDAEEGMVYLVSKRENPAGLYALPLQSKEPVKARRLADIRFVPPPPLHYLASSHNAKRFKDQTTALDLSGNRAVLLTYGEPYLVERHPGQSWAQAFAAGARRLPETKLLQAEAACLSPDGKTLLIGGEKSSQPLRRYELP